MRPVLAFLTAALILGGLQGYFLLRDRFGPTAQAVVEPMAEGVYSIEITLTFDAGPDPFALEATDKTCLEVLFRGQPLLRRAERVAAGEKVVVSDISSVAAGSNEFFIRATPAESRPELAYAARVRLLRDGSPLAEQSLWSNSDGKVEGTLTVDVTEVKSAHESAEGHP